MPSEYVITKREYLQNIGDAIREKLDDNEEKFKPSEMANGIRRIKKANDVSLSPIITHSLESETIVLFRPTKVTEEPIILSKLGNAVLLNFKGNGQKISIDSESNDVILMSGLEE